jgi:FkbM family methyltransferase
MPQLLKRVAARFPIAWQHELKRHYYAWQIRSHRFRTEEREYQMLESFAGPGDWVIDVGANVGHYTAKLSGLVGPAGRVLALEPVPSTFELLTHNSRRFPHPNVTLLNVAATDVAAELNMQVPNVECGAYLARVTHEDTGLAIVGMPLDCLRLHKRVSLVKIDAEGHELSVLRGMTELLQRDRPNLIVEVSTPESREFLLARGYEMEKLPSSPNCIFRPKIGDPTRRIPC